MVRSSKWEEKPATIDELALTYYYKHLSKGRAKISEVFGTGLEHRSEDCWVYTASGERFLNAGGYGVFIMGARHPLVEQRVIDQIKTNPISSKILIEPQAAFAAKELADISPQGLEKVHFAGSGTEATEAALKLARTLGKHRLISTTNGYHGKTLGALSITSNPIYQSPFFPLLEGCLSVPYGDASAMEAELKEKPPACVIIEPIQGEGGVIVPPDNYLSDVRALCDKYDALLVFDEIQSGMGRTGRWWCCDHSGVIPDVMLVGKGLSGGIVPVSAIVAKPKFFRAFDKDPFIHTSTFSCAPVAMAAVRGSIEAIKADNLIAKAENIGTHLIKKLQTLANLHCPHLIKEVRGKGLLIGIELKDPGLAGALLIELVQRHILINYSLNANSVLRLTPPATLRSSDINLLLSAFGESFIQLNKQFPDYDETRRLVS